MTIVHDNVPLSPRKSRVRPKSVRGKRAPGIKTSKSNCTLVSARHQPYNLYFKHSSTSCICSRSKQLAEPFAENVDKVRKVSKKKDCRVRQKSRSALDTDCEKLEIKKYKNKMDKGEKTSIFQINRRNNSFDDQIRKRTLKITSENSKIIRRGTPKTTRNVVTTPIKRRNAKMRRFSDLPNSNECYIEKKLLIAAIAPIFPQKLVVDAHSSNYLNNTPRKNRVVRNADYEQPQKIIKTSKITPRLTKQEFVCCENQESQGSNSTYKIGGYSDATVKRSVAQTILSRKRMCFPNITTDNENLLISPLTSTVIFSGKCKNIFKKKTKQVDTSSSCMKHLIRHNHPSIYSDADNFSETDEKPVKKPLNPIDSWNTVTGISMLKASETYLSATSSTDLMERLLTTVNPREEKEATCTNNECQNLVESDFNKFTMRLPINEKREYSGEYERQSKKTFISASFLEMAHGNPDATSTVEGSRKKLKKCIEAIGSKRIEKFLKPSYSSPKINVNKKILLKRYVDIKKTKSLEGISRAHGDGYHRTEKLGMESPRRCSSGDHIDTLVKTVSSQNIKICEGLTTDLKCFSTDTAKSDIEQSCSNRCTRGSEIESQTFLQPSDEFVHPSSSAYFTQCGNFISTTAKVHPMVFETKTSENRSKNISSTETSQIVPQLLQRGPHEVKYGLLLPPNRSPLKVLLVFLHSDPVSEAISKAADKLGFDVTFCSSYDGALEEFLSKLHDLVIIDTRAIAKSLDYDTLCRSIRNTKGSQHTAVVAIVKKSVFDKDDVTVLSLLDAGYNRCIVETSNIVHCVNELIQLKHSDMRPMAQAATSQALYAALDKCRDIVLITDDSYRLQYANRSMERILGYRYDETLGKTLQEQLIYDPVQMNTMSSSLMRARDWQGQLALRRKGHEPTGSVCKAVPITCAGRAPTHFVMVMDTSGAIEPLATTPDKPRGSVHSIRRGSTDVRSIGSDYLRRTSLAKLSALPLEAPITKIITLLTQVQEQSSTQVSTTIDKVIDILRSTELYSPHVKDDLKLRSDEPVTSDLITALLTQQPQQLNFSASSRRSSNDSSSVVRSATRTVSKVKVPVQIKDILDTSLTWEFDIFRLEELTNKRPLIHLGMNLMLHFDVPNTLNCDEKTLYNWLTVIEMNYHADNTYHNSTHAADVMQATAGFLEKDRLKSIMEPLDEATSLLAACAHDIDHPGRSSAFLSNCDNPLAILYNDVTILENHHAALTFKLTLGDDRVNIFKHLDRETYKIARHNVVDMILATEMTKHFEHLAKFVNVFCTKPSRTDLETEDFIPISLPENITLIKRMMIKCADVSNPTRPLRLCVEWARRIAEEYFSQTDDEKTRGLPVVMPMFDRTTCSIPKSQIGFVDYIVHDMFEAWDAFIDMPELVTYMRQNYIRWKEFDEQGHTTSADIRKLQNTVLMVPVFSSKNPPK